MSETPKPEQSPENSREAINLPPVLFIYRDNDLFKSTIPETVSSMQDTGRKVEVKVFPKGTTKEEIARWLKEHSQEFNGKEVMSDGTVSGSLDAGSSLGLPFRAAKQEHSLDEIMNNVSAQQILGEDVSETFDPHSKPETPERDWELTQKGVIIILKRILEDPSNTPGYVGIRADHLRDHGPLSRLQTDEEAMQRAKEWLVGAGVPEEVIDLGAKKQFTTEAKVQWYIIDRHVDRFFPTGVKVEERYGVKSITLSLPLASLLSDSVRFGLLKPKPEEFERFKNAVRKSIEKKTSGETR